MSGRLLRQLLRWLGPLLLVLLVVRLPERGAMLEAVSMADGLPFLAAVLLTFLVMHVKVWRWRVLLSALGVTHGWRRAWVAYLSAGYVAMLTPGRVGEIVRVQYLRRDCGLSYAVGLGVVVVDRLADMYVLALFAALGVAHFSAVLGSAVRLTAWVGVASAALGPLALLIPGVAERLLGRLYRKLSGGGDGLQEFLTTVRELVRPVLLTTVLLTLAAFGLNYVQGALLSQALHSPLALWDVTCLMAIASLLSLLPVTVSGLGVREGFFALVFPSLGYAAVAGVSFGLALFVALNTVLVLCGLLAYMVDPPPTVPKPTDG
jgi:uncharacterized protein (TIRG00374 family)